METDVCTAEELSLYALRLIALTNCCQGDTLKEAIKEIEKYADDDYYDEEEMLNQIVMWMKQKL